MLRIDSIPEGVRVLVGFAAIMLAIAPAATGATEHLSSLHDPTAYPLVWREPDVDRIAVRRDVEYHGAGPDALHLDVYTSSAEPGAAGRAALLFVSGIGDRGEALKECESYRSWLATMAARGYVAAMGETDPSDVGGSLEAQLGWLLAHATELGLDTRRIGLWASSANVAAALDLAMSSESGGRLRAAALLYGAGEPDRLRADLPVLLLVAGRDAPERIAAARALASRAVASGAPWTVTEAPDLAPAFDTLDRSDASLAAVRQVLSWLDAQLAAPPLSQTEDEEARAAREALLHLHAREWQAAHDYYNELADAAGALDPRVWKNLAWARRGLGSSVGEMVALEQALALEPDDLRLRRHYSRLAGRLGAWENVERALSTIEAGATADADDLGLLGLARLQLGQPSEAISPLERAVALGAEAATRYNLACALALTGEQGKALEALAGALAAGFADRGTLERDTDLDSLRDSPRFRELLESLSEPAVPVPEGAAEGTGA